MGTRRTEEIIEEVRGLSYTEDYSLTEGWNNNVLTDLLNRSLNNVYHAITQVDNPAYTDFDFSRAGEPSRWLTFLVNRMEKRVQEIG